MDDILRNSVEVAVEKTALAGIRIAKRYCPVRTGRLRRSIRILGRGGGRITWGSDLIYAYRAREAIQRGARLEK